MVLVMQYLIRIIVQEIQKNSAMTVKWQYGVTVAAKLKLYAVVKKISDWNQQVHVLVINIHLHIPVART